MAMNFSPSERQRELRAKSREFARDVLRGAKSAAESLPTPEERFIATRPVYERLVAEGFLRACIPESAGGAGHGLIDTAVVMEELYCENASVALTLLGTVLGLQPVLIGGTPDQQKRLLAPFLVESGAPLAGFCSSEPGGSANAAAPAPGAGVRTRAARVDDRWIITGTKKWVSSATGWDRLGADLLCVVCRTEPAVTSGAARTPPDAPSDRAVSIIAVEKPFDGLVLDRIIETPGHRAHLLPEFSFHDVAAPQENLLGDEGAGLRLGGASFAGAAALIGMLGVALMRTAFEHSLRFARTERRAGIVPILEHQAVGYALADAKMSIETARALSWRACCAVDAGHPAAQELANYSKIFGSETAVRVITDLMRVVGVESYDLVDPLNGLLQDALVLPIFAGGNTGVRRRALHALFLNPEYDPLAAYDAT